jgi:hypothetical protein
MNNVRLSTLTLLAIVGFKRELQQSKAISSEEINMKST